MSMFPFKKLQKKCLKFQNALSFSHHPAHKNTIYLLITEASEHRTTISVMEEEEVEELEECETEELEELEESSSGTLQSIHRGGVWRFMCIFLLCFLLEGKPTNYTKTKKNIGWCYAGRVCVCVCVLARKYLLNKT